MKARLRQFLAQLRRRASAIALSGAFLTVATFSVVLAFCLDIGVRQQPDTVVTQAIEAAEASASLPEVRQAIRALDILRTGTMQSSTRARLLTALGNLLLRCTELDPDAVEARDQLDATTRWYREARSLRITPEDLQNIRVGLVHVDYLQGRWDMARTGVEQLLRQELPLALETDLEMLRCRCLHRLGQNGQAYAILHEMLARHTAGTVHDAAKIMAAELLTAEYRRRLAPPAIPPTAPEPTPEPLPEAVPPIPAPATGEPLGWADRDLLARTGTDELLHQARAMLLTMLERLGTDDERRVQVLNGLLDLCILTNDTERAYEYVRQLEGLVGHRDQQIRSFDLLATLELSQGNAAEAEEAMRFCMKQFPQHEQSHRMGLRLFHLLHEQGRTTEALETFEALVQSTHSRSWARQLTEELLPENPDGITTRLRDEPDRTTEIAALRRILRALARRSDRRWLLVQERLLYLQPILAKQEDDYAGIEQGIAQYLLDAPFGLYLGEVLRLDAVCAQTVQRSPAIRAVRAHRYLAHFPEGPHSEEMLGILLRAYYEMGFYRQGLAMGEAAFVRAMVQSASATAQSMRLPVLQTMRWIAQCNSRLRNVGVAVPLFSRCSRHLDELDADADYFRDWATTALEANQQREAVRRFEVGARRLPAGPEREHLLTLALQTRCLAEPGPTMPAVRARFEQLRQNGWPADDRIVRPLCESLLAHCVSNDRERMPTLLAAVGAEFPADRWPSTWAMRYLHECLAANQPTATDRPGGAALPTAGSTELEACLHYLDTISALNERIDQLHERGL